MFIYSSSVWLRDRIGQLLSRSQFCQTTEIRPAANQSSPGIPVVTHIKLNYWRATRVKLESTHNHCNHQVGKDKSCTFKHAVINFGRQSPILSLGPQIQCHAVWRTEWEPKEINHNCIICCSCQYSSRRFLSLRQPATPYIESQLFHCSRIWFTGFETDEISCDACKE